MKIFFVLSMVLMQQTAVANLSQNLRASLKNRANLEQLVKFLKVTAPEKDHYKRLHKFNHLLVTNHLASNLDEARRVVKQAHGIYELLKFDEAIGGPTPELTIREIMADKRLCC